MNAAISSQLSSATSCRSGWVSSRRGSPVVQPAGFTLVELLVVIGIIAALAALVTPAVFQARRSAQNAAIKAEIDMLHMAIMNYKNEYGSFPPANGTIIKAGSNVGTDPLSRHLRRLFPRISSPTDAAIQAQCLPFANNASGASYVFTGADGVSPTTALVAWLWGFTDDPQHPIVSATSVVSDNASLPTITVTGQPATRKLLYDFDRSRITEDFAYHPQGKRESPYIYIDRSNYGTALGVYQSLTGFNSDTFQILCAGLDGEWSEDRNGNGVLDAGEDRNGNGVIDYGDDDLSNFWKGTRKDYLDSIQ